MDSLSWSGRPIRHDLNLPEHLWAHLKLELHRQYPDSATLGGSPQFIKRIVCEQLMEI